jgi:hypothetical protein
VPGRASAFRARFRGTQAVHPRPFIAPRSRRAAPPRRRDGPGLAAAAAQGEFHLGPLGALDQPRQAVQRQPAARRAPHRHDHVPGRDHVGAGGGGPAALDGGDLPGGGGWGPPWGLSPASSAVEAKRIANAFSSAGQNIADTVKHRQPI